MARVLQDPNHLLPARLEQRLALDIASAALFSAQYCEGPSLLIVSSHELAAEALQRTSGRVILVAEAPHVLESFQRLMGQSVVHQQTIMNAILADSANGWMGERYCCALWASPQVVTWPHRLRSIDAALAEGALLAIVLAGPLARLLAPFRSRSAAGEAAPPFPRLRQQLVDLGYDIEHCYSIGGLGAVRSATLARFGNIMARPDLVDRWEAGYRSALSPTESGRLALARVLLARKRIKA